MEKLISICIPTYQRLPLLKEAVESCLAQTYRDLEILISDDSKDDETQAWVELVQKEIEIPIRYFHNRPSLGQAGNVNQLFQEVKGERLLLLHDDDVLFEDALEKLTKCWEEYPDLTAAYGKQVLISEKGVVPENKIIEHNARYHRDESYAGLQKYALASGLIQQFPNDGYLVMAEAAQQLGYSSEEVVGDLCCDYDFALRITEKYSRFYYLDEPTVKYRISETSVTNSCKDPRYERMLDYILGLDVPEAIEPVRLKASQRLGPTVVKAYLEKKNWQGAFKIFFSSSYAWDVKLSLKGVYHFLWMVSCRATSWGAKPQV